MLVVVSNWGFSDGTLAERPRRRPIDGFLSAACGAAVRAGFRRDGRYRPISRFDIVLAGDTFDWLLSSAWLGTQRPWRRSAASALSRVEVTERTILSGRPLLSRLARLIRRGVEVPSVDSRGRPAMGHAIRIPVQVTLLTGDRDSWLEEDFCRRLAGRFGLAIGQVWAGGGVVVQHGSGWDPACDASGTAPGDNSPRIGIGADRPPTLAESLSVDLLVPFARLLSEHAATRETAPRLVRTLAAARPLALPALLAAWLAGRGQAGSSRGWLERRTLEIWQRAVEGWHRLARRDPPLLESEFDLVDRVANLMADVGRDTRPDAVEICEPRDPMLEPGAGETTLVYGHPSAPRRSADGPQRIVCLGIDPLRRSSIAAGRDRAQAIEVAPLADPEIWIRHACLFNDDEYGGLQILSCWSDEDEPPAGPPLGVPTVDAA